MALTGGRSNGVTRLLLDHNADEHIRDNKGGTALHRAAKSSNPECVRILLECDVDVNARDDDGLTPLLRVSASWRANPDVLRLLLDHGADENVRDNKGGTPLHHAATGDNPEYIPVQRRRRTECRARLETGFHQLT